MPKLLLLDGHSLAYRAFYALPADLATPSGTFTNAVFGFTSMLAKVLTDEKPDYIAVAFDTRGPTFRDAMDPEYKAGRKETPDVFSSQMPLIREVLDALKIPVLEIEGVEADDVIATLATGAADAGTDVVVVTGDRDSFQLVRDPHLKVLYNMRGVSDYALYDEAGIIERTKGVTPAQYPDYAAMRGDTSDNLPGVPGIGEKTAAKLITTYGNLEGILEHLDELPPKQRENLGAMRDRVLLNREMSLLRLDVDCGIAVGDLRQGAFDREEVRVLFDQLAFRTLLPRMMEAVGEVAAVEESAEALEIDVDVLRDPAAVAERLGAVAKAGAKYALEPRWAGAPGQSAVVGLGLATGDGNAAYLDADALRAPEVAAALEALVGEGGPPLVAHRAKELMHGLDLDVRTLADDTAVMAYLLDPAEGKYQLEDLALRFISLEITSPDAEEGTLDLDGQSGVEETARRAVAVLRVAVALEEALGARELTDLYERIERPLVRVLAKMEDSGIRVDREFLDALRAELAQQCESLVQRIWAHAGEEFNVNSTPQLRVVLFDKLGLVPVKKTKTGPSTGCGLAPEDGRGAPDRRGPPALPGGREAAQHVRRRAAAAHPRRRPRARDAQADRHDHGPDLEREPEPAERPGPHRGRPRVPASVRRRRRLGPAHGRLLPDRAPRARAPRRRPRPHRCVRPRPRRAHRDGGEGVRRGRVGRDRRAAALRQGRELRPRLRHGGVRPRAASRCRDG